MERKSVDCVWVVLIGGGVQRMHWILNDNVGWLFGVVKLAHWQGIRQNPV